MHTVTVLKCLTSLCYCVSMLPCKIRKQRLSDKAASRGKIIKTNPFDRFSDISARISVISGEVVHSTSPCQISRLSGQCVALAGRKTHFEPLSRPKPNTGSNRPTYRTTSYFMDNACACGSPVIGWSTHAPVLRGRVPNMR